MDTTLRTLRGLRIHTMRRVLLYTGLCTLFTVGVPVTVVAAALWPIREFAPPAFFGALAIAGFIPLFMAPPLAFVVFYLLRLVALTLEKLNEQVRIDPLTGALTRLAFLDAAGGRLAAAGGFLLVADADHFKRINDSFGHDVGDAALKTLAAALIETGGPSALVGRLGGEEFAVALPGADQDEAAARAAALLAEVRGRGRSVAGHALGLTASLGGAAHAPGTPLERTLKAADTRLYAAKRAGRDRAVLADPAPAGPDGDARALQQALLRASAGR